jgi:shikimate kinase
MHMRIGLVGMSRVGKTYWATKLAGIGFKCIHCDDMIAAHLAAELGRPVSFDGLNRWLGLPHESGFKEREATFLTFEAQTLHTILSDLSQVEDPSRDLVVDMSGSAIYAGVGVFRKLRQFIAIVYLALTPDVHQRMFDEYARRPRAVIWKGQFQRDAGDTQLSALKACYPRLIAFREGLYEEYCDVKMDYATHRQANLKAPEFVQCVRNAAQQTLLGATPPA